MKKEHIIWLQANDACGESIGWIKKNNIHSLQEAWNTCQRGDWLLWMAEHLGTDERKLAICAALSAHTVVQHMKDPRSREAVRVAFLWGRGKATDADMGVARKSARDVWEGHRSAFWAANTALSASWVNADDWAATRAAARAARAAESAAESWPDAKAAKKENELRTANIARKVLTEDVINAIQTIN